VGERGSGEKNRGANLFFPCLCMCRERRTVPFKTALFQFLFFKKKMNMRITQKWVMKSENSTEIGEGMDSTFIGLSVIPRPTMSWSTH
jgi:hypothetical protein